VKFFGVPNLITSERLRECIDETGGFTIRRRNGRARAHGVCVATRPNFELAFAREEWNDVAVTAWLGSFADERRWRASHLGGWHNPETGIVVLDVVRVVPCRLKRFVFLIGKVTRQEYAFDLTAHQVVSLA
jgi:hypothetical protein